MNGGRNREIVQKLENRKYAAYTQGAKWPQTTKAVENCMS
jgi:hypothetical protein